MKPSTIRARLLASSMITGVALAGAAGAAFAADTTDTGSAVGELVITGSRIPSKNLTSVSPVTTINNTEIKLQGTTNVEDFINNLPQVFAGQGNYESNGATGTASVNLRNLGPTRTLVLIDGKRLMPGDPTFPVADIDFIPSSLIERVELDTGGASAVYGSDAVAGVVNFIMKHDFQGIQIDAQTSIAEHNNNNAQVRAANVAGNTSVGFPLENLPSGTVWTGQRHTVTITGGVNTPDNKGNVEFYFAYVETDPVLESKYDWSTCSLATDNTFTSLQYCAGSTTDATGRLKVLNGPNAGHQYDILLPPVDGALQAFNLNQAYNFAPLNYIARPDVRYQAGEFSHYEVNKALDIYSSFMFMDDHSVAQIGPSGSFYGDNTYTIPCSDPLLSTAQASALCGPAPEGGYAAGSTASAAIGRRNVEGGGRISDITHDDYRIVIGAKGDIGQGWNYDISMQYGRVILTNVDSSYFLNSHLLNALNVVEGANGPVCVSGGSCVPYNIWSDGGVTQAALNYLNGTGVNTGFTQEQVVSGSIAGDLGQYGAKSPFATEGLGISVGAEYRREFLSTTNDSVLQSGDLAGLGGEVLNTEGAQSDKDIFGELRVPILQDKPFAKDLTLETGYRYSDYTSGGGNNTYKVGLDWQIIPDLRLRASYQRAVRAPNVQELFDPQTPGEVAGTDPCAGATPSYTAAQCYNTLGAARATITEAQFADTIYGNISQCISSQCGNYSGGNPNLSPEVGGTVSYGFVFTPTFFKGFNLTVDYFNIIVGKYITTLPLNLIFSSCAVDDSSTACSLIVRDATLGYTIYGGNGAGYVSQTEINAGALYTSGFDVNANYRLPLSDVGLPNFGSLSWALKGTYTKKLVTVLPGESYDCAGLYGLTCGTPTPKWRHELRMTWSTPWNVSLTVNWRYLHSTGLDFNTSQPGLQDGAFKDTFPSDARIPDFNYFDVAFSYKFKDRYTLRGGVNNIFDRTPPLLDSNSFGIASPPYGNGNTYPQVFDPLGRVLFVGLTADF